MYCHADPDVARKRSRRHMRTFFASNVRHYEMAGEHFAKTEAANATRIRSLELFAKEVMPGVRELQG